MGLIPENSIPSVKPDLWSKIKFAIKEIIFSLRVQKYTKWSSQRIISRPVGVNTLMNYLEEYTQKNEGRL